MSSPPDATLPESTRPVLLLAPLAREAVAVERSLENPRPAAERPAALERLAIGRLAGRRVAVAVTGDGAARAKAGVAAALEVTRPGHLLVFGVAGALSPGREVGDLVWARRVVGPDGRVLKASGASRPAMDDIQTGVHTGTVLTHHRLVTTPTARATLLERATIAGRRNDESAVVDLESSHYATAAEAAGVPWTVLRAVSDTVDDTLPAYLERCRDAGGSMDNTRVVLHALARPWTFPTLLRLGRRVTLCSRRLADALTAWLANRPNEVR